MIPNFTFVIGYMSMSALSWLFPAWRALTLVIAGLTLPYLLTYWFWPESPRWLYSVGRYEEGEAVLTTYIKKSGVNLEEVEILASKDDSSTNEILRSTNNSQLLGGSTHERRLFDILMEKCQAVDVKNQDTPLETTNISMLTLFTSGKFLAATTLNICFQFIVIVMAYYGLSYSAGDLPGNIYVNNVINGLVEVAAYVVTFFSLNSLGRRALTAGPLLFSGVCMIFGMLLTQYVTADWAPEVFRWLMFAGKMGVSCSFAVIYIYSAELFPTDIRGTALGLGSMAGRIGGVCAPYINKLWPTIPWLPPTIYGAMCILSGLAVFLLPETSGRPMLNTIEEANAFYGKHARRMSVDLQSASESAINLAK